MENVHFADKVLSYLRNLNFDKPLPNGIRIMNPYKESSEVMRISEEFYRKYYSDNNCRQIILGINPGRFGAGLTGIPFTDPKHLVTDCQIEFNGNMTHEPSSVYIYDMIKEYGGVEAFYQRFFIGAVSPLGFVSESKGKEINYNYYDSKELMGQVVEFITDNLKSQIDLGIDTTTCFCLGAGKNYQFLHTLNKQHHFFKKIVKLEHPRFIMQYRSKTKDLFIEKYIQSFNQNGNCFN